MNKADPNAITLRTYNERVNEYLSGPTNQSAPVILKWLEESVKGLPKESSILEIGTGSGVDADYVESLGYRVTRTDGSSVLVDHQIKKGKKAAVLNVVTDKVGSYDLIFTSAVLQHLSYEQMLVAIDKIYRALPAGGRFALSVSRGKGEEWTTRRLNAPRYFRRYRVKELQDMLEEAGFALLFKDSDDMWIRMIVLK